MGTTGSWAEDVLIKSVDFTNTTNFPAKTYGDAKSATTQTVNGVYIKTASGHHIKLNNSTAGVDFDGTNIGSAAHCIAIPVTGVNGKITVKVIHNNSSNKTNFKIGIAHATDNDPSGTQTWDLSITDATTKNENDCQSTKTSLSGTQYIVWIGEASSSYKVIKSVEIYTEASGTTYTATSAVSPAGTGSVTMKNTNSSGSTISSGSSVASGTTIWMQADPATGYNFSAWSGGTTGSSNPTTAPLDDDKTFTANFVAKTYTITLNKGTDGTANGTATVTYNSSTLASKTDATKTGYSLTGYFTDASGDTKVINADGTLVASVSGYTNSSSQWIYDDDATLYAQWEAASGYTITYDVNTKVDGSTAMADAIAAAAGQTTLPNPLPTPANVQTGYTFLGWYTDAALTTSATAGASIDAATTLYANYKINATTISPASGNIKGGQTLTIAAPTGVSLTKAYYKWSNSKTFGKDDMVDSSGNAINSAGTTTTGSFTGTATTGDTRKVSWVITDGKWWSVAQNTTYDVHSYSVTYQGNGNTGGTAPTDASSPYAKSSTPTVLGAGTLVNTGYTFNGWNTVADGSGTAYAASSTLAAMTANVTLYAQWVAAVTEYTITLNGNDGTGGSASVTATLNETLPSFTAPIRSGYVLKGYYTADSGGTKVINADGTLVASTSYANSSSQWISTANLTVYAQWDPIYTVTFDATTNGGTCATASLTQASYGASIILPAATKEGYTFDGWFEASSGGEPVGVAGASYIPSTSKILYAQFSAAVATTKFHFVAETSETTFTTSGEEEITTSNKATTLDDGQLWYNSNGSSRDRKYGLKLGANTEYIKITLDNALAIGDVITFDQGTDSNQISFTKTATRATTPATSENTYTVTSTDGLAGESTIYVWRASGSTTYVKEITITTSGEAATYAVSFEMGGIADDIEQLTEQTTLPNPLPTPTNVTDGYTFEGWYTDSDFTTAATAGATLGANATLYANYIIDTPTISQNGGEIYADAPLSLTADVPFTQVYAQWTGADATFSKATAVGDPSGYRTYNGTAVDTYNFTCADGAHGTRYFAYMISDGTFYSVPAITSAFSVSHLITISEQPTSATYIKDAEASAITVSAEVTGSGTDAGTLSYQWKQCATEDGDYVNVSAGSGGTTDSYTPVTSSTGTTYFKCVISSDNGAASVETNVVYVTVNSAAAFTVSFDKGIGSSTEVESITEASSGVGITLPSVTVSSADRYQFDGWYLEGEKVGTAYESYSPSGNVTLTAKYNCKVVLERGAGEGNVPTAVRKDTGATVTSGSFVPEGTTITLTASPAGDFVNWSVGMTGTENPKDYVVNDYKRFVANYVVPEYKKLFHTTFTESGWSDIAGVNGGGTASGVGDDIYAPHDVTLKGGTSDSYTWTSGKLTVPQNYGSNNYIAIPVKGVNGELTITVANGSSKTKFKYNVVLGAATNSPGSGTSTTKAAPSTVTVTGLTASNYVVYIGRTSSSYKDFTEITITTPNTSLTADSAQVRVMGTVVEVPVHITTSYEGGTISIKTDPTSSIATASYNSGTGVLTITSVAAGTTSVVMQLEDGSGNVLRELEIPITVQVPTITITTQPSDIVCYQHDATEKTMSVVATVNTGNELTYQWYSNTEASTSSPTPTRITGATSATYTLNTADKAIVGTKYYFCRVTSATDDISLDTEVKSVTVSALTAGTYSANLFVGTKGNVLTYSGLGESTTISSGAGSASDPYTATISSGTLTITSNKVGTGTITLSNSVIINVTVKKHTISLIWSADSKSYNVTDKGWSTGSEMTIDDGSHPENLPYLIRLYEDGTEYTGRIDYYIDDTSIAYFGSTPGTGTYTKESGSSTKPTIRYGGTQGGCKFYAYIDDDWSTDAEEVKASYDLRLERGYSNVLPSGRKVEVQQQYTMYIPDTETKLITVTYGGYKYNDHTWNNKADSWGSAAAISGLTNIDGYKYAVRNKDRDAADEYMHAVHQEDDNFGSAWYDNTYTRIKPFRLPCRASYLTFYAHKSGTLTAYVYQNGIVGRGGSANQLASGPRLGYWFDQDGWVQHPIGTVVSKQTIANSNARDKRAYGGYADQDAQLVGYWTNTDDAIVVKMLRSKYCKSLDAAEMKKESNYELDSEVHDGSTYPNLNPYYWGKTADVTANNNAIMPTPERPIPHQNGYMIVNEGYVKYTINVVAGKTYYFFGKMTKVGYAGMNFIPAEETSGAYTTEGFTDYSHETTRLDLATDDNWTTRFGASGTALKNTESTLYDQVTVPSNYRIGKWNTICLPFAVNENQVEEVFGKDTELAIFNGLRHDTENHVYYIKYLRHVDQNILPGQPYLIYPTGRAVTERSNQENGGMAETGEDIATVGTTDKIIGSTSTGGSGTRIVFKNVLIEKGVTAQSYGSNTDVDGGTSYVFTGTDQQKAIAKYDLYITPKSGELKRYMPTDPATTMNLNTYHAFVKAESAEIKQDAITFAFTEDDVIKSWEAALIDNVDPDDPEVTGIESVEESGVKEQKSRIANGKTYNLMGQEVDARSAKGIVISNGKKVMQ
ncbi:MAG: InlB B-repeat-containing protein [Prevotella sp.]|nr:InlB B-repeat-containing protein [Prevotella sp.]